MSEYELKRAVSALRVLIARAHAQRQLEERNRLCGLHDELMLAKFRGDFAEAAKALARAQPM